MALMKKMKLELIVAALCVFFAQTGFAAEQDSLITLDKAKELVRNNSRILSTTEITKDKLGIQLDIAYNTYVSSSIKNNINGYIQRITQLNGELESLNPATDSVRINEIRGKIEQYEIIVSKLKENMPDESFVRNYKTAWRTTDEAYRDMSKIIDNMEKSLDFAVEKLYFTLLDLQNSIEQQNMNMENLGRQLRIERLKVGLGVSNKENENAIIAQYNLLKNAVNDLKSNEEMIIWQLNDMMGRQLDASLQVKEEIPVPVKTLYSNDSIYENALRNSLEIAQKERQIKDFDLDKAVEQDSDQREILKYSKKIAETELIDLKVALKEKIKSLNNEVVSAFLTWEAAVMEKGKAQLSHEFNEIRFSLGTISEVQREQSKLAYLNAVNEEKKSARAWRLLEHRLFLAKDGILE